MQVNNKYFITFDRQTKCNNGNTKCADFGEKTNPTDSSADFGETISHRYNCADFGEKIGNIGLGLLCIAYGKTETVHECRFIRSFTQQKAYSKIARVVALVLFIIAFPVTIPLAGIGYIGMTYSKSHRDIFDKYQTAPQRLSQIQKVRDYANNHQNHMSNVLIPGVYVDSHSLIEQKTLFKTNFDHNVRLYYNNLIFFTEAVEQLAKFLSKNHIENLVTTPVPEYSDENEAVPLCRKLVNFYNKVKPFIEYNESAPRRGIALIGIERMETESIFQDFVQLVQLFPFHYTLIMETAKKNGKTFSKEETETITETAKNGARIIWCVVNSYGEKRMEEKLLSPLESNLKELCSIPNQIEA